MIFKLAGHIGFSMTHVFAYKSRERFEPFAHYYYT